MLSPPPPGGSLAAASAWDRLRQPIWLFDPSAIRGVYANPAAVALWGARSQEDLLARDFSNLSHTVRTRMEQLQRVTADGASVSEQWTFYPNGAPVTVQAVISAYALEDGRSVLLFEAASLDVQPQERRAVEALRHTSSLITLLTLEGRPLFTNPAAIQAYGPACGFVERFEAPEAGQRMLAAVQAGAVVSELLQVRTAEGVRSHHLDARSVLDPATGEGGVLLSERDVTPQVEAERGLLLAEERAAAAVAKQRFLAGVSHDLRTPLTSIIGYADMLSAEAASEVSRSRSQRIAGAGRSLLDLINTLIDLSELDSGGVALRHEPFGLRARLKSALAPQPHAGEVGRSAPTLDLDPRIPDRLMGDAERVGELFSRLVALADADGVGALTLKGSLVETAGASAHLEFALVGQDEGTRRAGQGGRPLASQSRRLRLAVVRALVGLMAGSDGASAQVSGEDDAPPPVIRLTFPLAEPHQASEVGGVGVGAAEGPQDGFELGPKADLHDGRQDAAEFEAAGKPLNILYADDHENNRILVQSILNSQGYACETVCDGAEAVKAADEGDYDLVLLDVQMPVMDGVSAAGGIRALSGPAADVPILALTANTLSADRARYLAAGMNDCLAKPVNFMELIQKVEHWSRRPL